MDLLFIISTSYLLYGPSIYYIDDLFNKWTIYLFIFFLFIIHSGVLTQTAPRSYTVAHIGLQGKSTSAVYKEVISKKVNSNILIESSDHTESFQLDGEQVFLHKMYL